MPLTVVDLETTGLASETCRVIEVCVIQVSAQDRVEVVQSFLVNSGTKVPSKISALTGITQKDVNSASRSEEIWPYLLGFLSEGVLTAHHLAFDLKFLVAEYERLGISFQRPKSSYLCTSLFSKLMLPGLTSYSLAALARHLKLGGGRPHRAEADAWTCLKLAQVLIGQLKQESQEKMLWRLRQQWISLADASGLMNIDLSQAKKILSETGTPVKYRPDTKTFYYQRGAVEKLCPLW